MSKPKVTAMHVSDVKKEVASKVVDADAVDKNPVELVTHLIDTGRVEKIEIVSTTVHVKPAGQHNVSRTTETYMPEEEFDSDCVDCEAKDECEFSDYRQPSDDFISKRKLMNVVDKITANGDVKILSASTNGKEMSIIATLPPIKVM